MARRLHVLVPLACVLAGLSGPVPAAPSDEDAARALREAHAATWVSEDDDQLVFDAPADPDRPWLGVMLDVEKEDGVARHRVTGIADNSPAEGAGLRVGDVIVRVNGQSPAAEGLLSGLEPGDRVTLDVLRDGETVPLTTELESHPGRVVFESTGHPRHGGHAWTSGPIEGLEGLEALKGLEELKGLEGLKGLEELKGLEGLKGLGVFHAWPGSRCAGPRLGVHVEVLGEQLARYFGTESGKGLLVTEVVEGSPAEEAGLRAGDVLVRVDDAEISSVDDIRCALADHEDGARVQVEVLRREERRSFTATLDTEDWGPTGVIGPDLRERIRAGADAARRYAEELRARERIPGQDD